MLGAVGPDDAGLWADRVAWHWRGPGSGCSAAQRVCLAGVCLPAAAGVPEPCVQPCQPVDLFPVRDDDAALAGAVEGGGHQVRRRDKGDLVVDDGEFGVAVGMPADVDPLPGHLVESLLLGLDVDVVLAVEFGEALA